MGIHSRQIGSRRYIWEVQDLWRLSADLAIEEVDPAEIINLDVDGWFKGVAPSAREVLAHMKRILDADLDRPVILCPEGRIMDGAHRVCKALLLGMARIRCVRFAELPPPSRVEESAGFCGADP